MPVFGTHLIHPTQETPRFMEIFNYLITFVNVSFCISNYIKIPITRTS
jgi:hypothetical protein